MYFLNLSTFEDNLNTHNEYVMQRIHASEMDSATSTIRNYCVSKYYENDGSIKQYRNDRLVSISTRNTYTLVKNPYPGSINQISTPNGIIYNDKFKTESVIVLSYKDPIDKRTIVEKTYLAENLKLGDMTWDASGNLLTPVLDKWVHAIINLKYVNAWIKDNIPELVHMRNNSRKLNSNSSNRNVVAYVTDVSSYINNNATEAVFERLLNAANFKELIASYLSYMNDENAYIHTYFDTYEELEQYKSSRLGKNK
jgi:hypothetical protein